MENLSIGCGRAAWETKATGRERVRTARDYRMVPKKGRKKRVKF